MLKITTYKSIMDTVAGIESRMMNDENGALWTWEFLEMVTF